MLVFPNFLQNFSERQILWSLCPVVFHALTLKLLIQTSLSVALKLPVSLCLCEKCGKQAHPRLMNIKGIAALAVTLAFILAELGVPVTFIKYIIYS